MTDAYAAAGVDTTQADRGVAALVEVLRGIDAGRPPLTVPLPGHYASVIRVAPGLGIALATDSVGSKVIVAEQPGRFDTIGIDCVAMNVNDLICVGAEPLALLDYIAVERADPAMLRRSRSVCALGAEAAGVEIPGGEVCQVPEVIRGHPSPYGLRSRRVGVRHGRARRDRRRQRLPARRRADRPAGVGGALQRPHARPASAAHEAVGARRHAAELDGATRRRRAARADRRSTSARSSTCCAATLPVHGLAHITGGGSSTCCGSATASATRSRSRFPSRRCSS